MANRELKITRIGNSRGIRLPAETLRRYGIGDAIVMEERLTVRSTLCDRRDRSAAVWV